MNNATGQTLRSLMCELPAENVFEVAYEALGRTNAFMIPESAAPVDLLLRGGIRLVRTLRGRTEQGSATGLNDAIKIESLSWKQRLWRGFRAAADVSSVRVPRRLREAAQEFAPDAIYTLLGNVRIMKLAVALSEKLNVPIVPHFMDDWPSTLYPNGELRGRARLEVERTLERVVRRSPVVMCIGNRMAEQYNTTYARPTRVAAFGIEEERTPDYVPSSELPRRLVYAGGLHLGRQRVLEWVASQLDNTGWIVDAYTPKAGATHANIRYQDPIPVEDVHAALSDADALLFVESLDPAVADYTRLSVSTKTAQYVGANRPVILIGPDGQASMDLLAQSLTSQVRFDELTDTTGRALREYLLQGLPAYLDAHDVPRSFSGRAMRETFNAAMAEAVMLWQREVTR